MGKENYRLKVKCTNCGSRQTMIIPVGYIWYDGGIVNYGKLANDTRMKTKELNCIFASSGICKNCGCSALQKDIV